MYETWYSNQMWDNVETNMYVPQKEEGKTTTDYFEDDWSDLE